MDVAAPSFRPAFFPIWWRLMISSAVATGFSVAMNYWFSSPLLRYSSSEVIWRFVAIAGLFTFILSLGMIYRIQVDPDGIGLYPPTSMKPRKVSWSAIEKVRIWKWLDCAWIHVREGENLRWYSIPLCLHLQDPFVTLVKQFAREDHPLTKAFTKT